MKEKRKTKLPEYPHVDMLYVGWPENETHSSRCIDKINSGDIKPEELWSLYISQRKPVVIQGHLTDPEWKASSLWTDEYMARHAGSARVQIEQRKDYNDRFGKGTKSETTFAEFISRLKAGDATVYMSAQDAPLGPDGHPEALAPPALSLAQDVPLRPALLGRLVPQQINLWMGCAPDGASSGLHHDFHDNLYILLRGRKRFRLFPPSDIETMYVHGIPKKVYPNGRVVYAGKPEVLPDGSSAKDVAAWCRKRNAEKELAAAEEAVRRGEEGAQDRLAAAEDRLDQVLGDALDDAFLQSPDIDDFECLQNAGRSLQEFSENPGESPDSFSRIDPGKPAWYLRQHFPKFPGFENALECEIQEGQMLYLPAGWFHEVTSFSGSGTSRSHLALNYWMHPPDVLDPGCKGLDRPYSSEYWADVWASRELRYLQNLTRRKNGQPRKDNTRIEKKRRHHHHEHGSGCDCHEGVINVRNSTPGERNHFLRGIRGMFGYGRRQHLHRFVNLRFAIESG